MQATQPTWTDERMDEFAERTEKNFREVRAEIRDTRGELRREIRDVKTEVKDEINEVRIEMNTRFDGIQRRFDILFAALATGFIGAVVPHFLG